MRIRRAGPRDARAFAALARSEIETGLPHRWTAARLTALLGSPDTNAYALVPARGPGIGGFSVARLGLDSGHLILHAIAPGLRRHGFGRELLDWQVRAAVTAGLTALTLEVRAGNADARHFYTTRGFRDECRLPRYYAGREDALRLRLDPLATNGPPPPFPARPDSTDHRR